MSVPVLAVDVPAIVCLADDDGSVCAEDRRSAPTTAPGWELIDAVAVMVVVADTVMVCEPVLLCVLVLDVMGDDRSCCRACTVVGLAVGDGDAAAAGNGGGMVENGWSDVPAELLRFHRGRFGRL